MSAGESSVRSAVPHRCPACSRRFVVVEGRSTQPRCACGAALVVEPLDGGVYELRKSRRASRRRPPPPPPRATAPAAETTPDLGYGESHGYGPAHGGPSGPGDAPAPAPAVEEASPDAPPLARESLDG